MATLAELGCSVLVLVAGVIYFTASAVAHELGHWLVARWFGASCQLQWHRTGPVIMLTTQFSTLQPMTPAQDLLTTSAGVVMQLLINLLVATLSHLPILVGLAFVSLPLIAVNIVPIEPTDGYYVIRIVARRRGDAALITRCVAGGQWLLFAAALITASWYALHLLLASWRGLGGGAAALGILGVVILFRVVRRLGRLNRAAGWTAGPAS